MNASDWLASFALAAAIVGLYFARSSARSSEKSAHAAELSARKSSDTLKFDKEKFEECKKNERKKIIDALIKEAVEKWMTFGNAENVINRHPDLTKEETEEIRERAKRGAG